MAREDVEVHLKLTGEGEYVRGLKNARGSTDDLSSSVTKGMLKFEGIKVAARLAVDAFQAVSGAARSVASSMLESASNMENQEIAFTTLLGSAEAAKEALLAIKNDALRTPFELSSLVQMNQVLIGSGLSAQRAESFIMDIGDALSATGRGSVEMERVGFTISQVIGKGRADMIDFKELVNAGWVSVKQDVADAMGVSRQEFDDLLSAGKITFGELEFALQQVTGEGGRFEGAMVNMSKTLTGVMSNLKDTITVTLGDFARETGIYDAVTGVMTGVTNKLLELSPIAIEAGKRIASIFSGFRIAINTDDVGMLSEALSGIGLEGDNLEIMTTLLGKLAGFLRTVGEYAQTFWTGLKGGFESVMPYIKEALQTFGVALADLFGESTDSTQSFMDVMKTVGPKVGEILGVLVVGVIQVVTAIVQLITWSEQMKQKMLVHWNGLKTGWDDFKYNFQMGWEAIKSFFSNGFDAIRTWWNNLKSDFLLGIETIKGWFTGAWAFITTGASNAIASIQGFFSRLSFSIKDSLNNAIIARIENAVNTVIWTANNMIQALTGQRPLVRISIPRLEYGGIIPGNSYTGDKVVARVNSGEMVLTSSQQSALFNLLKNLDTSRNVNFNAPVSFGGNRSSMQQETLFTNMLLNVI